MYRSLAIIYLFLFSIAGLIQTDSKVDASDGTSPDRIEVTWEYTPETNGTYSIYRSKIRDVYEEDPVKEDASLSLLLDQEAEPGVIYFYKVAFKTTNKILEVGQDAGHIRIDTFAAYVPLPKEEDDDSRFSGPDKIRIDSLSIPTINEEDFLLFNFIISNYTENTADITSRFWLSSNTIIDTTDINLYSMYHNDFLAKSIFQKTSSVLLPSQVASGNYYLIGEVIRDEETIHVASQPFQYK